MILQGHFVIKFLANTHFKAMRLANKRGEEGVEAINERERERSLSYAKANCSAHPVSVCSLTQNKYSCLADTTFQISVSYLFLF
jgi:hypothetical protein